MLRLPLYSRPITVKPRDRIPSDTWLKPDMLREWFSMFFIFAFAATLMAAWNFHFPTSTERMLWRISSAFNVAFTLFGGGYVWLWEYVIPKIQKRKVSSRRSPPVHERHDERRTLGEKLRNISSPFDPELEISLSFLVPISALCGFYCICRMYIFIEDFIRLRNLPPSAFETVDWAKYIPHV
jgi:hypothetical protein